MACNEPRTYLPVYRPLTVALPVVPNEPTDWWGIRRFLEAVRELLIGRPANAVHPGIVPRFTVTQRPGGNLLTWDHEAVSAYYIIYRGTSNNLNTARTVGVISEGSGANSSFFDACGQEDDGTPLFYWIEPFTGFGQSGPLSLLVTTAVDCGCSDCPECASESFRPLTYAKWDADEAPSEVNPVRSRVVDASLGTDVDAAIGLSATRVDMQIDSTNAITPNYAQWFAYNFPEPDSGRTLVSATVWARAEFDSGSASPGDLASDICVFNTLTHTWPSAGVGTVHTFAMADTPVANYSRTWTAAQFATDFSSLASNVYVRAQQYAAVGNSFSPEVHMYIYDVWIQYLYA